MQSDFQSVDFLGFLANRTFTLSPLVAHCRIIQLSLETVIQGVEICPGLIANVPGEFVFEVVSRIDGLCDSKDDRPAQELFQGLSRLFDLLSLHDSSCRLFKFVVGEIVAQLFDCSLHSVHLVLILNKVLTHMSARNVG